MTIKLSDKVMVEVVEKVAEGLTGVELVEWLKDTKGIVVNNQWILKRLKAYREVREELFTEMVREKLQSLLTHDLDHIQRAINRAYNDEINARKARDGKWDHDQDKEIEPGAIPGSEKWSRLTVAARGHRNDLARFLELRMKLAGIKGLENDQKPLGVVMLPAEQD